MERQRGGKTEIWKDRDMERQRYGKTEIWKDRDMERQRYGKTEIWKDRYNIEKKNKGDVRIQRW